MFRGFSVRQWCCCSHGRAGADIGGQNLLTSDVIYHQANAVCERFLGSVRRECLDHFFIFQEKHLSRLLNAYVRYFNQARPHQGLQQRLPDPPELSAPPPGQSGQVLSVPMLGGLHHDYQRAA
ncbi:integrase core domain-containing protein [Dictyobacter formicarum]|uniref:integrase core domain-containing protein n=1 Tax=Dictyobacter formicarum TaxID=2778368 RepID=UPI00191576FC|nr:integrase core domain-containing protein [Dictyobacter formicarum]